MMIKDLRWCDCKMFRIAHSCFCNGGDRGKTNTPEMINMEITHDFNLNLESVVKTKKIMALGFSRDILKDNKNYLESNGIIKVKSSFAQTP